MATIYDESYEFSCSITTEHFFHITLHCAASNFAVKGLHFHLEDGGSMFHCNISNYLPDYAMSCDSHHNYSPKSYTLFLVQLTSISCSRNSVPHNRGR